MVKATLPEFQYPAIFRLFMHHPLHAQDALKPACRCGIRIGTPSKGGTCAPQSSPERLKMVGMNHGLLDLLSGSWMFRPEGAWYVGRLRPFFRVCPLVCLTRALTPGFNVVLGRPGLPVCATSERIVNTRFPYRRSPSGHRRRSSVCPMTVSTRSTACQHRDSSRFPHSSSHKKRLARSNHATVQPCNACAGTSFCTVVYASSPSMTSSRNCCIRAEISHTS